MMTVDQLLGTLWRRKLAFLLTFVIVLAGVAAATFSLPKSYASTSYVLVVAGEGSGSDFEATQTNQVILKTYAELLQARSVAEAVADELPFETDASLLQQSVSVTPVSQSQLIRIRAEASSPERAQLLADTYASVFVDRAIELGDEIGTNALIGIGERASLEETPVEPRPRLYLAVGAFLAALLGTGVAMLRDRLDQRLDLGPDTTEVMGLPVLARLPQQARSPLPVLLGIDPAGPRAATLVEAFSLLLTNIAFLEEGRRPRSLVVLSPGEGEGKSTTCVGIGSAASAVGASVLLVDGDLRRPRLTSMLGGSTRSGPGFAELLGGSELPSPEAIASEEGAYRLHLLPAGVQPANPVGLIGSGLGRVDRWARTTFDLVVYDTPPVVVGADGSLIAANADAAIVVIDVRKTRRSELLQAVDQLQRVHAHVLGIVLNRDEHINEAATKYYGARREAQTPSKADAGDGRRSKSREQGRGKSSPAR